MSTIFDIAREAGVSITTVSRALNGYSDVSEQTRRRVVEIAQSLDYYPSAAARNLQGRRTDTVAFAPLLREHIESEPFFKEFLGLLTLSSFRHGLSLLATVADSPSHTNKIYRELVGSARVDGIIVADIKPQDERIELLQSLDMPFVAFGRTARYQDLSYPLVDVDNEAGMRSLVDYLVAKGHRRIAYLSGPFNTSYSMHRYQGYREGLRKHNLPLDERLVIANLQEHSKAREAVARLLSPGRVDEAESLCPTAIAAANDRLALQVVQELQSRGIEVGSNPNTRSIAVTGFDDLPFAAFVRPPLTTVRQPIATISDILLDLLVQVIRTTNKKKAARQWESAQAMTVASNGEQRTHAGQHSNPKTQNSKLTWIGPMQALVAPELVVRASA